MKKILLTLTSGLLLTLLIIPILASSLYAAEKTLNWKMPILYPRGAWCEPIYHGLTENVKAMSGRRLLINEVYDGEGVSATKIFDATKNGLVEMGCPYMALHAGQLPVGLIELGLPGAPTSYIELRCLFHESGWKEILRKAYAKHNLYWVGEYYQPGVYLLTKKPIRALSDLGKMKIRAPGAYGTMIRNLGAAPVTIAGSEIYTSLATGVIDGVTGGNLIDWWSLKVYEVAKYMYPLQQTGSQVGQVIVNLDAWNKLSDDLKTIIETATFKFGDDMARKSLMMEKSSLKEMMDKGLKISPKPSESDAAKWTEAGRKVWPYYESKSDFCKELIEIQAAFIKKLGL